MDSNNNLTIRNASFEDALDIARIHVASWQATYAGIIPDALLGRLSVDDKKANWEKILSKTSGITRVAANSGGLITGWISFGKSRDEGADRVGEIYAIYLDPLYRGQGIGTALMKNAIEELLNQGFSSITLWVLQENKASRRFYEKASFLPDENSVTRVIEGKQLIEVRYRYQSSP